MSKVLVTDSYLTAIADFIREKNESSTTYKPSEMEPALRAAFESIESSSGGVDLDNVETLLVDFYYDADLISLDDGIIYQTRRLIVS